MRKLVSIFFAVIALGLTACSSDAPLFTPTPAPRTTWTPTVAHSASATAVPVPPSPAALPPTNVPTIASAQTPIPPPTVKPGLYVTNLRVDPNPPLRGVDLIFHPSFLNATGAVQNFRWLVYIYRAGSPTTSFSETTAGLFAIPVGNSTLKSVGAWKISLGGPCENFVARVAWMDDNNKAINFTKPDGQVFEHAFTVCAPSDLPSPTPGPSPTPTPTPTFAPGVFAMDLRTDPNPPTRGADLKFYVTFANTIGSLQMYRWNLYIYRPGERNSYGELTQTTTMLGIGINEYQVDGVWKLPLGGPCENFVARVGWFDQENKLKSFVKFENEVFEKPLTICPP